MSAFLTQARLFATIAHKDQKRGDGETPYVIHVYGAEQILAREANVADVEVLAAALLHDTMEDTSVTYEDLVKEFGKRVADIVLEVTDPPGLTKEQQREWQVKHVPELSAEARLVKLADKLYNLRDLRLNPPPWTAARKRAYVTRAGQIAAALKGGAPILDGLLEAELARHA